MSLIALGSILGTVFENGAGPTHDRLDRAAARAGVSPRDSGPGGRTPAGSPIGKTKRVGQILVHATDHDPEAGLSLSSHACATSLGLDMAVLTNREVRCRSLRQTGAWLRGRQPCVPVGCSMNCDRAVSGETRDGAEGRASRA